MSQPTARPTATPPDAGQEESDGRVSKGEGAGDGGADGHPVGHQRGGIVDQALALEDGGEAPVRADGPEDRDRRHRIGRRHDGAQRERRGPGELRGERVRHHRDGRHREQHDQRSIADDGPELRPEIADRAGERRPIEERRDEDEEQGVGLELHLREPRHEHQRKAGEDQEHRVRHAEAPRHEAQRRRDREHDDDELYALHAVSGLSSRRGRPVAAERPRRGGR